MKKIQIALCDDEAIYTEKTKHYISTFFLEHSISYDVHVFRDGREILDSQLTFDIAILDVDMEDVGGIEVKDELHKREWRTKIIFLSNYDMYMEDSFGRDVYGFVRKDKMEKLIPYVKKIVKEIINEECVVLLNVAYSTNDILYIMANGNYVDLVCLRKRIMVRMCFSEVLAALDSRQFMQVHRSYIVNFKYVKSHQGEKIYLEHSTSEICISRRKKKLFQERCLAYARWKNIYD